MNDVNYLVCCENKDWLVHVSRLLQRSGMNNDKTQTNIANDSRNSSDSTPPISVQAGHKEIDASKDDDEEHSPTLRRVECGDSLEDDDYNVDNSGSDNDINEGLDNSLMIMIMMI